MTLDNSEQSLSLTGSQQTTTLTRKKRENQEIINNFLFSQNTSIDEIKTCEEVFVSIVSYIALLGEDLQNETYHIETLNSSSNQIIDFCIDQPLLEHTLFLLGKEQLFSHESSKKSKDTSELNEERFLYYLRNEVFSKNCKTRSFDGVLRNLESRNLKFEFLVSALSVSFKQLLLSYKRYFHIVDILEIHSSGTSLSDTDDKLTYDQAYNTLSRGVFRDSDLEDIKTFIRSRCGISVKNIVSDISNKGKLYKYILNLLYSAAKSGLSNTLYISTKKHCENKNKFFRTKDKSINTNFSKLSSLFIHELLERENYKKFGERKTLNYFLFIYKFALSFSMKYSISNDLFTPDVLFNLPNYKIGNISKDIFDSLSKLYDSIKYLNSDKKVIQDIHSLFEKFHNEGKMHEEEIRSLYCDINKEIDKLSYKKLKTYMKKSFSCESVDNYYLHYDLGARDFLSPLLLLSEEYIHDCNKGENLIYMKKLKILEKCFDERILYIQDLMEIVSEKNQKKSQQINVASSSSLTLEEVHDNNDNDKVTNRMLITNHMTEVVEGQHSSIQNHIPEVYVSKIKIIEESAMQKLKDVEKELKTTPRILIFIVITIIILLSFLGYYWFFGKKKKTKNKQNKDKKEGKKNKEDK